MVVACPSTVSSPNRWQLIFAVPISDRISLAMSLIVILERTQRPFISTKSFPPVETEWLTRVGVPAPEVVLVAVYGLCALAIVAFVNAAQSSALAVTVTND